MMDRMTDNSSGPAATAGDTKPELDRIHPYAPRGYHNLTPFIAVRGGAAAIDFYQRAFDARVLSRMDGDAGTVLHAELVIGDSVVLLSDEIPSMGIVAPAGESVTGSYTLYVADAAEVHARAVAAGAKSVADVADVFSGDRMGVVMCPFGHRWVILTRIEDVPEEEIERRAREWVAANAES
jgi:uncharacterized glyoxalase superfamily protein PhnB